MQPDQHRPENTSLVLPRGLIFAAALWLVGSFLISIGIRPPIQAASASYEAGVRMMIFCTTVGLTIAWPMMRLSQAPMGRPAAQIALDLIVLLGMMQVVVWPLRLFTAWTSSRVAALDLALAAWAVLLGAIVAAVMWTDRAGPRLVAMLTCLAAAVGLPVVAWSMGWSLSDPAAVLYAGPLVGSQVLLEGGSTPPKLAHWWMILVMGIAAVFAWIAILLSRSSMAGPDARASNTA